MRCGRPPTGRDRARITPLLFQSERGLLYYSSPREESFTIPVRERNPLLFQENDFEHTEAVRSAHSYSPHYLCVSCTICVLSPCCPSSWAPMHVSAGALAVARGCERVRVGQKGSPRNRVRRRPLGLASQIDLIVLSVNPRGRISQGKVSVRNLKSRASGCERFANTRRNIREESGTESDSAASACKFRLRKCIPNK